MEKQVRQQGLLAVVSGPSGVGKTTITHEIERRLGGVFSISATTRPQTALEVDGRDYFFISPDRFQAMIDAGEFLEFAQVFGKHWYGTPRKPVEEALAAGKLMILDIDVQGALSVRRSMPQALMLFIEPPSDAELERRLRSRARDDEPTIQRRLAEARSEIDLARSSGAYDRYLVNADLEATIEEACEAVRSRFSGPAGSGGD